MAPAKMRIKIFERDLKIDERKNHRRFLDQADPYNQKEVPKNLWHFLKITCCLYR
jgi:hypothetical protein